ncbi:MAG: IMP cyclohydrolase [Polyangiales bacterium]
MPSPYTGQGLAVGRRHDGAWVVAYWITARSARSHNRVLEERASEVATVPLDVSRPHDPYTLYPALRWARDHAVVGNGAHVQDVTRALTSGRDWRRALAAHRYAPDAPYYTPRVVGVLRFHDHAPRITLAKVRRVADSELAAHAFYEYADVPEGAAMTLSTYDGASEPRDNAGDPLLVKLGASATEIGETLWRTLDPTLAVGALVQVFGPLGERRELWLRNAHAEAAEHAAE